MRAPLLIAVAALTLSTAGCGGGRESFGVDTTWDLVACTTEDAHGFSDLGTDYPPADLGGMTDARVLSASDTASNKAALGLTLLDENDERLGRIEDRLRSDPRVTSTHRRSTLSDACF